MQTATVFNIQKFSLKGCIVRKEDFFHEFKSC